ncbi:MAG: SRPBCC family protein [Acidimicrobiales bacterium]
MTRPRQPPVVVGPLVDESDPVRLSAQRLRNTLRLNAITSSIGGIVAATAAGPMAGLFETGDARWFRAIGVGLVAFAFGVAAIAGSRMSRLLRWVPAITIADVAWVLSSVTTIVLGWYSNVGVVVITAVAIVVGWLALQQAITSWRTRKLLRTGLPSVNESPPIEVFAFDRIVQGDVATAWQVITDHELYGRLAPNLSRVSTTAVNGPNVTRTCANRSGKEWHETCTLWDDGHRYAVAVDTADYPYPLAIMVGTWGVQEVGPGRVRIKMEFRFQPSKGIWGRTFVAAMHVAFPPILKRILRGWRVEISQVTAARR